MSFSLEGASQQERALFRQMFGQSGQSQPTQMRRPLPASPQPQQSLGRRTGRTGRPLPPRPPKTVARVQFDQSPSEEPAMPTRPPPVRPVGLKVPRDRPDPTSSEEEDLRESQGLRKSQKVATTTPADVLNLYDKVTMYVQTGNHELGKEIARELSLKQRQVPVNSDSFKTLKDIWVGMAMNVVLNNHFKKVEDIVNNTWSDRVSPATMNEIKSLIQQRKMMFEIKVKSLMESNQHTSLNNKFSVENLENWVESFIETFRDVWNLSDGILMALAKSVPKYCDRLKSIECDEYRRQSGNRKPFSFFSN